jgi:hypothetical protein
MTNSHMTMQSLASLEVGMDVPADESNERAKVSSSICQEITDFGMWSKVKMPENGSRIGRPSSVRSIV